MYNAVQITDLLLDALDSGLGTVGAASSHRVEPAYAQAVDAYTRLASRYNELALQSERAIVGLDHDLRCERAKTRLLIAELRSLREDSRG